MPYSQNSIPSLRELLSKVQKYLGGPEGMLPHKMLNIRASQVSYETDFESLLSTVKSTSYHTFSSM